LGNTDDLPFEPELDKQTQRQVKHLPGAFV